MTLTPTPSGKASESNGAAAPGAEGADRIELVERYFDENAEDWSDLYAKAQRVNDLVLAARRDMSVDFLEKHVPAGGHVLDAGCGAGLASLELIRRGFRVHLIDVSSKMLGLAERNLSQANVPSERYQITRADPGSAGLGRDVFDGVAALGFLQYQKDEVATLRALHAMMRPGATLVVTGPTKVRLAEYFGLSKLYYRLRAKLKRKPASTQPPSDAARQAASSRALLHSISSQSYGVRHFRKILQQAGFEMLDYRGHGFVNFAIIGKRLGFKGELFLHRFFTGLSRVLPISRFANDLVVVARRT